MAPFQAMVYRRVFAKQCVTSIHASPTRSFVIPEASQKLLEVERWSPGGNNLPSATFKLSSVLSDGETIMNEANLLQALGQVSACETGKIFRLNKGVSGRSRSGKRSKNRDSAFGKGSRAGHDEHSGRGASRTRSIESRPNLQACGGCSDEQRFRGK